MKEAKKVDPRTNRERQATYRRERKAAGWKKVSFYLSAEERAELEEYRNGTELGYAVIVAVRESRFLRRQVDEMKERQKYM